MARATVSRNDEEGLDSVSLPEVDSDQFEASDLEGLPTANGRGGPITNAASFVLKPPYFCDFTIVGTAPILFHRWSPEAVEQKAAAKKGSEEKKTDNTESFIYRNPEKVICLPGEYVRQSLIGAARYKQDPRSPRKSAMDLYKAIFVSYTELAPLGGNPTNWDYLDQRRVVVQRQGVNRKRPAFEAGWEASFRFCCLAPDYCSPQELHETLNYAGLLVGTADFRPTYGRYRVTSFKEVKLSP